METNLINGDIFIETLPKFQQSVAQCIPLFADDKSEEDSDELQVVILTYPVYCRLRAMLRRLEAMGALQWLTSKLAMALVGFQPRSSNCHVLYCRDSYEHPDLEALDIRCDHLGRADCIALH